MMPDPALSWGVLSDMDGTLLDTESTWLAVVERFAVDHGMTDGAALAAETEGLDLDRAAALLSVRLDLAARPSEVAVDLDRRALAAYAAAVIWRPGAPRLLDALVSAEVPRALVTSSPRHWVERFARRVDLSAFQVRVTADDTPRTKPAPDPYLLAADALGLPPERCIALEDTSVGAQAAMAAGCVTVVVGDAARLLPPGVHRVGSLDDLDVPILGRIVQSGAATSTSAAASVSARATRRASA